MIRNLIYLLFAIFSVRRLFWFNNEAASPQKPLKPYAGRSFFVRFFVVLGGLLAAFAVFTVVWEKRFPEMSIEWLANGVDEIAAVGYAAAILGLWSFGIAAIIVDNIGKHIAQKKAQRLEDHLVKKYNLTPDTDKNRRK